MDFHRLSRDDDGREVKEIRDLEELYSEETLTSIRARWGQEWWRHIRNLRNRWPLWLQKNAPEEIIWGQRWKILWRERHRERLYGNIVRVKWCQSPWFLLTKRFFPDAPMKVKHLRNCSRFFSGRKIYQLLRYAIRWATYGMFNQSSAWKPWMLSRSYAEWLSVQNSRVDSKKQSQ